MSLPGQLALHSTCLNIQNVSKSLGQTHAMCLEGWDDEKSSYECGSTNDI
jgi:hypothetical protein